MKVIPLVLAAPIMSEQLIWSSLTFQGLDPAVLRDFREMMSNSTGPRGQQEAEVFPSCFHRPQSRLAPLLGGSTLPSLLGDVLPRMTWSGGDVLVLQWRALHQNAFFLHTRWTKRFEFISVARTSQALPTACKSKHHESRRESCSRIKINFTYRFTFVYTFNNVLPTPDCTGHMPESIIRDLPLASLFTYNQTPHLVSVKRPHVPQARLPRAGPERGVFPRAGLLSQMIPTPLHCHVPLPQGMAHRSD